MVDTKSLVEGLPANRQRGYVELGERVQTFVGSGRYKTIDAIALAKVMQEYARRFNVECLEKEDNESWQTYLTSLTNGAKYLGHELDGEEEAKEALEHLEQFEKTGKPFGYAYLTPAEKKHIHRDLNKIRQTIESSALDDRKKRAIYSRLNKLSAEVDKDGTNTDALFALMGEVSFSLSAVEKENRPVFAHVKDILKIICGRRAENEGTALPAPEDFTLLPPQSDDDE